MSTIRANQILDAAGGNTATINGVTPALATQAEAEAGTNAAKLMTPLRVAQAITSELNAAGEAPLFACRAWVNFNGIGTVSIRGSGNVSSVTDNSTGNYTVNFAVAMPDTSYAAVGMSDSGYPVGMLSQASGSINVRTSNFNNAVVDVDRVSIAIFR